ELRRPAVAGSTMEVEGAPMPMPKRHANKLERHRGYRTNLRRLVELGRRVEAGEFVPAAPPQGSTASMPHENGGTAYENGSTPAPGAPPAPPRGRVKIRSRLPHMRGATTITSAGFLALDDAGWWMSPRRPPS